MQATKEQCDTKLQHRFTKCRQCISRIHETLVESCIETLMSAWRWLGTCILGYAACDRSTAVDRAGQSRAEHVMLSMASGASTILLKCCPRKPGEALYTP